MELSEESLGEVVVLALTGRIDSNTAPTLGERLSETFATSRRRLVLDLRQVEYMSSAGFRILLLAAKRAEETDSRFVLCGLSRKITQLFDMGGFLDLFSIAASREDAITAAQ